MGAPCPGWGGGPARTDQAGPGRGAEGDGDGLAGATGGAGLHCALPNWVRQVVLVQWLIAFSRASAFTSMRSRSGILRHCVMVTGRHSVVTLPPIWVETQLVWPVGTSTGTARVTCTSWKDGGSCRSSVFVHSLCVACHSGVAQPHNSKAKAQAVRPFFTTNRLPKQRRNEAPPPSYHWVVSCR